MQIVQSKAASAPLILRWRQPGREWSDSRMFLVTGPDHLKVAAMLALGTFGNLQKEAGLNLQTQYFEPAKNDIPYPRWRTVASPESLDVVKVEEWLIANSASLWEKAVALLCGQTDST